jgi:hypothetical protein
MEDWVVGREAEIAAVKEIPPDARPTICVLLLDYEAPAEFASRAALRLGGRR